MQRLPTIFALLCFALQGAMAHAQDVILMINMNYSSSELAALEQVAQARGQRLEMIPPREIMAEAEALFRTRDSLEAEFKRVRPNWDAGMARTAIFEIMRRGSRYEGDRELANLYGDRMNRLSELAQSVARQERNAGSIYEQLRNRAAELQRQGDRVDSLVISSHSDGSNLTGETANRLSAADLFRLRSEIPQLFETPRHVLLLGCYNLTRNNRNRWRFDFFPNASMLAGFGVRGASRYDPLSPRFVTEVLGTADRLDRQMASTGNLLPNNVVQDTLTRLRSFTNQRYPGVADYCGLYVEGLPGAGDQNCDNQWEQAYRLANQIISNYLHARTASMNPPREGNGGEIRAAYDQLQITCPANEARNMSREDQQRAENFRRTVRESLIRLIFWHTVQQNYRAYFENDINNMNRTLTALGISPMPTLDGNLGHLEFIRAYESTRQALLDRINRSAASSPPRLTDTSAQILARHNQSRNLNQTMEELLRLYDPLLFLKGEDSVNDTEQTSVEHTLRLGGIPFNWIEGSNVGVGANR